MNKKITSLNDNKIPSYVSIYNQIYSDIVGGVYENGSQLPSEPVLAERYGVSRNTLRQALTILSEDHLIAKQQGKGTFITYDPGRGAPASRIVNPVIECARREITEVKISYNYGPPTEIAQHRLGIRVSEIVMASNNVYYSGGRPIGHSFVQIPVRYVNELDVDLNNEDEADALVNRRIFELASSAELSFKVVPAEDNVTAFLQVENETPIIYIEEILYGPQKEGIARCKFYFLPEDNDINFRL